jgi:hypothetical protein
MFNYKAFGLEISSEIELPGMTKGSDNSDVKIIWGEVDPFQVCEAEVEGPNYLVKGEDVYLWWDEIGKAKINKGELIIIESDKDMESSNELNIIPFLLGPVMALLLHQRGFLVLHGSAVNTGTGAVAFLGHRGNGKSTTAIHLYVEGYPLVADDILAIKFDDEGFPVVYPGYPHVRLSDEAYNQVKNHTDILTPIRTLARKVFCDASYQFSTEPVRLEKIYVIQKMQPEQETDTGISVLKSQENLIDLIRHSVANRIFQHTTQKENLINCAQLVNNVEVKRLDIVHSFTDIQDMVRVVEEDFEI